jgi:hypothetical protein
MGMDDALDRGVRARRENQGWDLRHRPGIWLPRTR